MNGSDVDWLVDNVHIRQATPQAFSIMSNELGYDSAGPQWVAMRPNDPAVRALGMNAVATLIWTLRDSNNAILATTALVAPPGERCFQDVVDPEEWYSVGQFTLQPVYWWRWEWTLPTNFAGTSGAYVTADGTLVGAGTHFSATSDPFDIQPDLAYSTLINSTNNLAALNSSMRHAYVTNWTHAPLPTPSAGDFDAGNENGEQRAHGLFASALCNVLKQRRSELSTQQIRDLVSEIKWIVDFLLAMETPENGNFNRYSVHTQQGTNWKKQLASHHLRAPFKKSCANRLIRRSALVGLRPPEGTRLGEADSEG